MLLAASQFCCKPNSIIIGITKWLTTNEFLFFISSIQWVKTNKPKIDYTETKKTLKQITAERNMDNVVVNIWMLQYFNLQVMVNKILCDCWIRCAQSMDIVCYWIFAKPKFTWIWILKNKMEKFVISHTASYTQNQIIKTKWHLVTLCMSFCLAALCQWIQAFICISHSIVCHIWKWLDHPISIDSF